MSVWKNIDTNPLVVHLAGPQQPPTTVQPGKHLTLRDRQDYLVGTLIGSNQVQKVDLDADTTTTTPGNPPPPPAAPPPPAPSAAPVIPGEVAAAPVEVEATKAKK